MNHHPLGAALLGVAAGMACAAHNYESPIGPRYAGAVAATGRAAPRGAPQALRVVTFNVRAAGFLWPTEHNPDTHLLFNWDHIFLKEFAPEDSAHTGVVRDTLGASDHHPVWAVGLLAAAATK
jgi:hypothetical protein